MMAPVVRHRTVADMTSDSHHFKTVEDLIAEGFEPDCPPPCDWCFIDAYDPDDPQPAHGNRIRPVLGHPFGSWLSYEDPTARRQYRKGPDGWEAICPIHWYMARLISGPFCGWCGDEIALHSGWCDNCVSEYNASLFGDYPPPTDCGCAWHNLYLERQPCWTPADDLRPMTGSMQPLPVIAGMTGQGVLI